MSHYFKNIKYHGLLLKNPMVCYKNRPIWSFQSIPGVFERELTVYLNAIVDVYSFGMVMYEIFSAQKPFQELNKDQVFLKTTKLFKCF